MIFLIPTHPSRLLSSSTVQSRRILWQFLRHRAIHIYSIAILLQSCGYGIPQTYLNTYTHEVTLLSQTSATLLLTLFNIPGIASLSFFCKNVTYSKVLVIFTINHRLLDLLDTHETTRRTQQGISSTNQKKKKKNALHNKAASFACLPAVNGDISWRKERLSCIHYRSGDGCAKSKGCLLEHKVGAMMVSRPRSIWYLVAGDFDHVSFLFMTGVFLLFWVLACLPRAHPRQDITGRGALHASFPT